MTTRPCSGFVKTMQRCSAFLLAILVAACSGGPPRSTPSTVVEATPVVTPGPADVLVDRMLHALETEDVVAWKDLLSSHTRTRIGADYAMLHDHLMGWRRDVLPLAQLLRHSEIAVDESGPEPVVTYAADGRDAVALAAVVLEDGALRLDEN